MGLAGAVGDDGSKSKADGEGSSGSLGSLKSKPVTKVPAKLRWRVLREANQSLGVCDEVKKKDEAGDKLGLLPPVNVELVVDDALNELRLKPEKLASVAVGEGGNSDAALGKVKVVEKLGEYLANSSVRQASEQKSEPGVVNCFPQWHLQTRRGKNGRREGDRSKVSSWVTWDLCAADSPALSPQPALTSLRTCLLD